jgi:hypothetical protein
MPAPTAVEDLLTRLRDWWQARSELNSMDPSELQRVAGELGMRPRDLEDLIEQGPHAADLLYDRLGALGLSREDVESTARGLMHDLERTCACCHEKGMCEKDLTGKAPGADWRAYCPNAPALDALAKLKRHRPA